MENLVFLYKQKLHAAMHLAKNLVNLQAVGQIGKHNSESSWNPFFL